MRLLIVDDSIVFRSQIRAAVESSMNVDVIGVAQNGKIALQKLLADKFDVMTLDLEMPEMDGLEVLREIKRAQIQVKVIVFSGQTPRSAKAAFDALHLGAVDVVAKPNGETGSLEEALVQVKAQLIPILKQFQSKSGTAPAKQEFAAAQATETATSRTDVPIPPLVPVQSWKKMNLDLFRPHAIVIGSSTGGPAALEVLIAQIRAPLNVPIFIVQHMPPVFTSILAQRIETITGIPCAEAKHGEAVASNRIYIAPGDFHMRLTKQPHAAVLELDQGPKHCFVRPAVDFLFESAAALYEKSLLGIVLTGMGDDGMVGAKTIKANGGGIMIQDKESSIVWGMPGAIHAAGAFDRIASLTDCSDFLFNLTSAIGKAS